MHKKNCQSKRFLLQKTLLGENISGRTKKGHGWNEVKYDGGVVRGLGGGMAASLSTFNSVYIACIRVCL